VDNEVVSAPTGRRQSLNRMKWILYVFLGLAASYVILFIVVLSAMLAPPERFGQFMKRMPAAVVWGGLPASRMWLWARSGDLVPGVAAPDFTLPRQGHGAPATLSSFRGQRPVVLVFGSYT
jgi:hypothetical protein